MQGLSAAHAKQRPEEWSKHAFITADTQDCAAHEDFNLQSTNPCCFLMPLVKSKAPLASPVQEGEGTHRRAARRQHGLGRQENGTTARAAAPGRCDCAGMARAARPPGSRAAQGAGAVAISQLASGAAARGSARLAPAMMLVNDYATAVMSAAACTPTCTACAPCVQSLSAEHACHAVESGASIAFRDDRTGPHMLTPACWSANKDSTSQAAG